MSNNNYKFNVPDVVDVAEVKTPKTATSQPLHEQLRAMNINSSTNQTKKSINDAELIVPKGPNISNVSGGIEQKPRFQNRGGYRGRDQNNNRGYYNNRRERTIDVSANITQSIAPTQTSPRVVDPKGRNYLVYIYIPNAHDSDDPNIRKSIGFKNDALVLKNSLEHRVKDIKVEFIYSDVKQSFERAMAGKIKADVGIFIQQVSDYKLFAYSERNWLLCNHEVFLHVVDDSQLNKLRKIDVVLCKTQIGVEWVQQCKAKYNFSYKICKTGFTSPFRSDYIPIDKKDANLIVHTAGQHHWKGTDDVLKCWYKYGKDLPQLIVTCFQAVMDEMVEKNWVSREIYDAAINGKIPNLTLYTKPIPYDELKVLKMKAGCHICTSRTEGFGHIINEGRICSGIIITTNAPPMNELVDKSCSIVINPYKEGLKRNGTKIYEVHPDHIRDAVKLYMKLPLEHRIILGERAHKKYLEDQSYFYSVMSKIQAFIRQGFDPAYDPFI